MEKGIYIFYKDGDIIVMESYADVFQFITCKKVISRQPRRQPKEENGNWRNDMELTTVDGTQHFSVFMRQNQMLPDHYSIGLRWHCQELGKWITLFRCNGSHGANQKCQWHNKPHTHTLPEENFNTARYAQQSLINANPSYLTYNEAIVHFCVYCGIQDAEKYFPQILSISLFPEI